MDLIAFDMMEECVYCGCLGHWDTLCSSLGQAYECEELLFKAEMERAGHGSLD